MATCGVNASCPYSIYPISKRSMDLSHRPILIIGESPTAAEAVKGAVMTGKGGSILLETMKKVGLPCTPADVVFTTSVDCAIPKIKGKQFPLAAPINCRERVLNEIRAIQPKIVIVCGKTALVGLTGNSTIKVTELMGRPMEMAELPGVTIFPVLNPGIIVHSPAEYKQLYIMFELIAKYWNQGSVTQAGETKWNIIDTDEKFDNVVSLLMTEAKRPGTYFACDLETTSLDYRKAVGLVFGLSYKAGHAFVFPKHMMHRIHELFKIRAKFAWQTGKYDKKVLWRRNLAVVPIDHDVAYLHYILDETSPHDLGYISKMYLQAAEYKYKMNQEFKAVTEEKYDFYFDSLCERVAVDCDYTYQLVDVLAKQAFVSPELKLLYESLLIPAANFLARVEQRGIPIDPEHLGDMDVKYQTLLQDLLVNIETIASVFWNPELYKAATGAKTAPAKFNPGSPKQCEWLLYTRMKLKPRIRKKGTGKEILRSIEPMPPLVKAILEYRKVQKEHSTYVIGLLDARDEDGCVRTHFNLHVTATGRLSSNEPNLQNQPSANGVGNVRRSFLARPNRLLAEIDYSGAELRWLAFLSKCPVLSDVFIKGRNLHTETATALFGIDFNSAQKLRAKAVNFGIPYGREAKSFVDEFNISLEEAQQMIDDWLNNYHGARDYLQWCAEQATLGKYLETPFGRRRRPGLVTSASLHALQNEFRNFPIQSSSSDLLLYCGIHAEKTLKDEFDTYIVNLVHDSHLLDMPADEEIVAEVGKYMNQIMVDAPVELFNCPIPFKTDYEIGCDWGNLVGYDYNKKVCFEEKHGEVHEFAYADWYAQNNHNELCKRLGL